MRARLGVAVLLASGLVLVVVGALGLAAPDVLHAANGLPEVDHPGLRSETRGAGAALLAVGSVVLLGVRVRSIRVSATALASLVLLAYAIARVVSRAADGAPGAGLATAGLVELALGTAAAAWVLHGRFGARTADRVSSAPR